MLIHRKIPQDVKLRAGFNRTELFVVVLALAAVLGSFIYISKFHREQATAVTTTTPGVMIDQAAAVQQTSRSADQSRQLAQCAENLNELGAAMAMYEKDNNGKLPYACIIYRGYSTWDTLLKPYLNAGGVENSDGVATPESANDMKKMLLCPADTLVSTNKKYLPRTYSMPFHEMSQDNWPPGPQNATGVGLYWSEHIKKGKEIFGMVTNIFPNATSSDRMSDLLSETRTSSIPAIDLKMIGAPASTLMLTELPNQDNALWRFRWAGVHNAHEQMLSAEIPMENYHQGQFNYLMVDGHVDALLPVQSEGKEAEVGLKNVKHVGDIWTIRPDD